MLRNTLVIAGLSMLLVACGDSKLDRGLSVCRHRRRRRCRRGCDRDQHLGGAVLGGAAGAATGVLTDEDDIDLGKPVWRR